MDVLSIGGPDGPVYFSYTGDQYITQVWGSRLQAGGSPLVVELDTPISMNNINLGELYQQLLALVNNA